MNPEFIHSNRRVLGEDLDRLSEALGLPTGEACWLYGYSLTKWSEVVRKNAKLPLKRPTMSLLVRALGARKDLFPLPKMPDADEIFSRLRTADPSIDKKRFSLLFGCEASSGYRWVTTKSKLSPALKRLFLAFQRLYDEAETHGMAAVEKMMADWESMVREEARARGVTDIFTRGRWRFTAGAPDGKPVRGEDLNLLREQMALSTMDACFLFGFSSLKWSQLIHRDDKVPLKNVTLALLARVLKKRPDLGPFTPNPTATQVYGALQNIDNTIDRKRMAILFGCEASSGYRWLTTESPIGPSLTRLFKIFMARYGEVKHSHKKSEALLEEWTEMVLIEARAREITDVFGVGRWVEVEDDDEDQESLEDDGEHDSAKGAKKNAGKKDAKATKKGAKKLGRPRKSRPVKPLALLPKDMDLRMGDSRVGTIAALPLAAGSAASAKRDRNPAVLTPEIALQKAFSQAARVPKARPGQPF